MFGVGCGEGGVGCVVGFGGGVGGLGLDSESGLAAKMLTLFRWSTLVFFCVVRLGRPGTSCQRQLCGYSACCIIIMSTYVDII